MLHTAVNREVSCLVLKHVTTTHPFWETGPNRTLDFGTIKFGLNKLRIQEQVLKWSDKHELKKLHPLNAVMYWDF